MNSPRSLEACRQLGINPQSLYYVKFKTFCDNNPDIKLLKKDLQKRRFDNINTFREEQIEAVKKKREEIIKEQEKGLTSETNNSNNQKRKKKKKKKKKQKKKKKGKKKERRERKKNWNNSNKTTKLI